MNTMENAPIMTPSAELRNREIVYTVQGIEGQYTFTTKAHLFANLMDFHTAAGQTLVGIDGINGYKAPALTLGTAFAHILPAREVRIGFTGGI